MCIDSHTDGKLYRIEHARVWLYLATLKDGICRCQAGTIRIEAPVETIVMKLPDRHEYAENWITVLYGEQVYFMESRYLNIEEAE